MNNLLIRADATTEMGTGHIMRCLALAQGWQERGGKAVFLSHCDSDLLQQRIMMDGFGLIPLENQHPHRHDVDQTLEIVGQLKAQSPKHNTWVAVDGYHFDAQYQKRIKDGGCRMLWIDDYGHADHYYADIVLNQNISADAHWYINHEAYSCLLLGSRYVLFRREFRSWQKIPREILPAASRVLVTMGGSDQYNTTFKILRALRTLAREDLEVAVVIGPSNPHRKHIEDEIESSSFTGHCLVAVQNMPEIMAWADIAISAGGSTCWELAFMGLPSIVIICSDNQKPLAEGLDAAGAAINLGWHHHVQLSTVAETIQKLVFNSTARKEMGEKGQRLIDGFGLRRLLSICEELN